MSTDTEVRRRAENLVLALNAALYREVRCFRGHRFTVWSVAFSPDGERVLSGSEDGTLRLWEVKAGKELRCFQGHTMAVYSVAFSPDGKRALSGSRDKTIRLWDVQTGKELRSFTGHKGGVLA